MPFSIYGSGSPVVAGGGGGGCEHQKILLKFPVSSMELRIFWSFWEGAPRRPANEYYDHHSHGLNKFTSVKYQIFKVLLNCLYTTISPESLVNKYTKHIGVTSKKSFGAIVKVPAISYDVPMGTFGIHCEIKTIIRNIFLFQNSCPF